MADTLWAKTTINEIQNIYMKDLKNIALFIDYENVGGHREKLDISIVINKLKEKGRIIIKKAYADWSNFRNDKKQMLNNSIELIEMPRHNNRKNSADIKLVVDALEIAITKHYIDTIVVLSGDSDFTPLISKLREYNKYVIAIGRDKNSTSRLLPGYCDEVFYYANLAGEAETTEEELRPAHELLIKTLQHLNDDGIETRGSAVKQQMIQFDSEFNEENYGFKQFKKFLQNAKERGIIELKQIENQKDLLVVIKEEAEKRVENNEPPTKPEKVYKPTNGNPKPKHKALNLLPSLFWAMKTSDPSMTKPVYINDISKTLRRYVQDFKLENYGLNRQQTFKNLLEIIQEKEYIELQYEEVANKHYIKCTQKFLVEGKKFEKPADYELALLERAFKIRKINYDLSAMLLGQPILRESLVWLEAQQLPVKELYEAFIEPIKELKTPIHARYTFLTLLQTNGLLPEEEWGRVDIMHDYGLNLSNFKTLDLDDYYDFYVRIIRDVSEELDYDFDLLMIAFETANPILNEDKV